MFGGTDAISPSWPSALSYSLLFNKAQFQLFNYNMYLVIIRGHLQMLPCKQVPLNYMAYDWKHADLLNPVHGLDPLETGFIIMNGMYGIK